MEGFFIEVDAGKSADHVGGVFVGVGRGVGVRKGDVF